MSGTLVAIADSGWDRRIESARVRRGFGLVDPSAPLTLRSSHDDHDRIGHGTACAQIVMEVSPSAEIVPIKVFGDRLETSLSLIEAAVGIALDNGASILNLSLATLRADTMRRLYACCEAARRRGLLIVAAADNRTQTGYPAEFDNVIGVRARRPSNATLVYRHGVSIECSAVGTPPSVDSTVGPSVLTNSYAAARVAGMLANFRTEVPAGTIGQARQWLCERALDFRPSDRGASGRAIAPGN